MDEQKEREQDLQAAISDNETAPVQEKGISRRQLLKTAGAAAIAGAGLMALKSGEWPFPARSADAAEETHGCCCNAKDYGAVGDGVTDDTAAIQSALDSCRMVYLPSGRYKTTATLYIPSNGGLVGEASSNWDFPTYGTWIVSSASIAIQVGSGTGFISAAVLDRLAVKRAGFTNGGAVTGTGILYYSAYYSSSRDLYVEGFGTGIQLGSDDTPHKGLGFTFVNTNIAGCDICIHARKAADVSFYGGRIGMNGNDTARGTGLKVTGMCDSISAYRLIIANNNGFSRCVQITDCTSIFWVSLLDCDLETATVAAFECDTNATFVRIDNSWVGSPSPFVVSAGGRIIFSRNTFANHDGKDSVIRLTGGSHIEINNNDFLTNPQKHIDIANASSVKIAGNNIIGGGTGIRIAPTSGASGGHIISNNEISGANDNGISIIANQGLSKVTIEGNHIVQFKNTGILIDGSGPAKCGYSVTGNVISTSNVSGVGRGISITNPAIDYYLITGNDTSSCPLPAINDAGGSHKVVANNLS
ncbi:right-handed parallel beta-helix repeat-containing protein [Paenibacillus mendelii]|uniref:Glycosyl hydrolase family 28-related protein n=1 Tax=Paenibacillus mendelii TaxID=206163 RepID=A0ABV6JFL2_9BACL|nr:right-handed parallel beta-helix repeat-containing protein [Paenibacillus mendelii]MCQ6557461.1 right-handed parallel beta-helix repeat-containing protein [Paenibacillus mendelii]